MIGGGLSAPAASLAGRWRAARRGAALPLPLLAFHPLSSFATAPPAARYLASFASAAVALLVCLFWARAALGSLALLGLTGPQVRALALA